MRFYLFQADLNPDDKAIATEIALAIQEQGQVPITIQDHNIYVELPS